MPAGHTAIGEAERQAIIASCEELILTVLKPRFLPRVTPTAWTYPVDLIGDWRGGRYRFIQRYRSGMADSPGETFDIPFARLDRIAPNLFDVQWMRHTGTWWRLHRAVTLDRALHVLHSDPVLRPP